MSAAYEWGVTAGAITQALRFGFFDEGRPIDDLDECYACPTTVDLTAWPPVADGEPAACWMHRGDA